MTVSIRRLVVGTTCVGTAIGVSMVLLGMEPRLLLVGCVVVLMTATGWLVVELGNTVSPLDWYDHGGGPDPTARPDRRVQALRTRLRQPTRRASPLMSNAGRSEPIDEVIDSLLGIIDDHLIGKHGVDRSIAPDHAAVLLGPELTRFVSDPASRRSMTDRRSLARTVSLIEDL